MVKGPEVFPNPDFNQNSDPSYMNERESGDASAEPRVELDVALLKKTLKIEALSVLNKENLSKKREQRLLKPDYYELDSDEVPYSLPVEESNLTRAGIQDRQLRPPTSKLLIPVMKYDPASPREVLWEAFNRREQAVRQVVIHPVKDLVHYKLRDCITCEQREKQLKAERDADPYEPALREFMVNDLNEGLVKLIGKVRCFHQEHLCIHAFMEMYIDSHFGCDKYIDYDLKTTREQLRKFGKLVNCYAETVKCLEMFCTEDQIDAFWKNSGLSSIYGISRNINISLAMKKNITKGEANKAAAANEAASANEAANTNKAAAPNKVADANKAAAANEAAKTNKAAAANEVSETNKAAEA